ncbi:MAG: TIGR03435 family protein [Acidobacteriota bacterium]
MLQTLLAERFKLQLRRETRELPVLVIKVTKNGHKLKEAPAGETPSFRTGKFALTAQNATLGQMAEFLSRELRTLVLDQTGLTGNYNYAVDINTFLTDEMRQALREGPPARSSGHRLSGPAGTIGAPDRGLQGSCHDAHHRSHGKGTE